ncbi:MAG: hypothetical protein QOG14_3006, partial [Mycobacterium sp.]|nr:hypothetical protein [Mycobacterium sp.]
LGLIKGRMIIRDFDLAHLFSNGLMDVCAPYRGGSSYAPTRGPAGLWADILAIYLHEGELN